MTITKNQTIAQCVANNYQTATIFKKHKIDFCCGGKISISEACQKNKVDEETLLQELNGATQQKPQEDAEETYELDKLAKHIVEKHHAYVRQRIPEMEPFLDKVVRVHGEKHPELKKVQENFQAVKEELLSHMQKEENVLFPYIEQMMEVKKNNTQLEPPFFGTIKNPINMMEMEHESAGNAFKEIRELTNDLTPPDGACNTYRVTFSLLDEFENDLHRHIHLENNVLFPKSIMLESDLLKA
ncbi:MAG: iron-sulfur cluster repair di-iron protein [Lutibacter sp.]|jgi:regulator of cell morphogenesis and NO signaling|nr:iron-sulfur cluster repair di-iron protein [Lutibacter sp.]